MAKVNLKLYQRKNQRKISNESRRNTKAEGFTRHDPRLTDQPA